MKAFLLTILLLMIAFTLWMVYSVVWHFQGEKIKAYWGRYNALKEADRLEKGLRESRLLKKLESNRIIELEALEEWDYVWQGKRIVPETVITHELIIIDNE